MKKNYIIIALIAVLIFLGWSYFTTEPITETNTVTEYETDTVTIIDSFKVEVYTPKPYKVIETVIIPAVIDTQELIKIYYSKFFYSDTIISDSMLQVIINDTIQQNRIISRKPDIWRKSHIITNEIHTTTTLHDNGVYIGGVFGQNLGVSVDYKHNYNIFGAMYDKNGFSLKYSRKLKFKK